MAAHLDHVPVPAVKGFTGSWPGLRLLRSCADNLLPASSSASPFSSLPSAPPKSPDRLGCACKAMQPIIIAWPPMPNGIQGQHTGSLQIPPPPPNIEWRHPVSVAPLEAVAKASHQNILLLRPTRGKTLLHGHRTGEGDGVGGIAFSLIGGGDT